MCVCVCVCVCVEGREREINIYIAHCVQKALRVCEREENMYVCVCQVSCGECDCVPIMYSCVCVSVCCMQCYHFTLLSLREFLPPLMLILSHFPNIISHLATDLLFSQLFVLSNINF